MQSNAARAAADVAARRRAVVRRPPATPWRDDVIFILRQWHATRRAARSDGRAASRHVARCHCRLVYIEGASRML